MNYMYRYLKAMNIWHNLMMNGIDVVKITDDKSMFTTKIQLHVYDIC